MEMLVADKCISAKETYRAHINYRHVEAAPQTMQNITIDPSVYRHPKSELEIQISKVSGSTQNSRMKSIQPHIVCSNSRRK